MIMLIMKSNAICNILTLNCLNRNLELQCFWNFLISYVNDHQNQNYSQRFLKFLSNLMIIFSVICCDTLQDNVGSFYYIFYIFLYYNQVLRLN